MRNIFFISSCNESVKTQSIVSLTQFQHPPLVTWTSSLEIPFGYQWFDCNITVLQKIGYSIYFIKYCNESNTENKDIKDYTNQGSKKISFLLYMRMVCFQRSQPFHLFSYSFSDKFLDMWVQFPFIFEHAFQSEKRKGIM